MKGIKLTFNDEEILIASSKGLYSEYILRAVKEMVTEYLDPYDGGWQSSLERILNSTPVEVEVKENA